MDIPDHMSLNRTRPISIPCKPLKTVNQSYDEYSSSIPKYGSYDNKKDENKITDDIKYSESSNFPNQPFGKSPPNNTYFKNAYLNYFASNNLRNSLIDN